MAKEWAKAFYKSKAWQDCRAAYISTIPGGICEECLRKHEQNPSHQVQLGYIVHHKIPLTPENINDPNVTLNFEFLEYVCKECHGEEHYEETYHTNNRRDTREGMKFDENGQLVKAGVYIVYGAPASGKTSYVKEHMTYGDLVIDLDSIKQALTYSDKTSAPDNVWFVANEVRECLYDIVGARKYDSDNVWIIAGLPKKNERERLALRLNAEIIFIDKDKQTCIKQALDDNTRKNKAIQLYVIDKWFNQYEK